jgi:hypothetical protein
MISSCDAFQFSYLYSSSTGVYKGINDFLAFKYNVLQNQCPGDGHRGRKILSFIYTVLTSFLSILEQAYDIV